jgi:hypothetical protein
MKTIDTDIRIKDIEPYQIFEVNIYNLLKGLLNDFDQSMDQQKFDHTYKQIAYLLKNKYKGLIWGDIKYVFNEISLGNYDIKNISVNTVMGCFSKYQYKKIEQNRIEYEKREHQLQQNAANLNKTPFGKAILFRNEMIEKGNKEWYDVPLKEIAEKIKSGEIKYEYISKKRNKLNR